MIRLMDIQTDAEVRFISRPNRFLGIIEDPDGEAGAETKVHVHDPGRLQELLYPGNRVLVRRASNPNRKTKWDMIAARFNDEWILINSGFHRRIMEIILANPEINPVPEMVTWKAEVKAGDSRLDFVGQTADDTPVAIETKGCTLAVSSVGLFPDAPTIRGARHLENLVTLIKDGYKTYVLIMLFRPDAMAFAPYRHRDPHFANCFYKAVDAGVIVKPLLLRFDGKSVHYLGQVPVLIRNSVKEPG